MEQFDGHFGVLWSPVKVEVPTPIAWQQADMELRRLTTVCSMILQTSGVVLTNTRGWTVILFSFGGNRFLLIISESSQFDWSE